MLIRPEISQVLADAGVISKKDKGLVGQLDTAGLSLENTLEGLANLAIGSSSEHIRLRALETSAKMHGVLRDQPAAPPSVTIVIQDSTGNSQGVNPILLPRQLLKDTHAPTN